jgi:hypothetical protein
MFRVPRRIAALLLWSAIALLPMRGLAAAAMPALMPAAGGATASATTHAADAMPCHGDVAHDTGTEMGNAASDAAEWGDCPSCSLCALCHGGLAQAPQMLLALTSPRGERPAAHPWSAPAPRAPDGLFRPPRPLLA